MNDVLGRVAAILICVWLMFLYPLSVMKTENMRLEKTYLYQETVRFLDGVRNTGKIEPQAMADFKNKVSGISNYYQIEFVHDTFVSEEYYEIEDIQEVLYAGNTYLLNQNDFVKIVIKDKENQPILCYGGSIKAKQEVQEVETS